MEATVAIIAWRYFITYLTPRKSNNFIPYHWFLIVYNFLMQTSRAKALKLTRSRDTQG